MEVPLWSLYQEADIHTALENIIKQKFELTKVKLRESIMRNKYWDLPWTIYYLPVWGEHNSDSHMPILDKSKSS